MCKRHALSPESAIPLLALVRKELKSPLGARNRILMLVDGNLAERARGSFQASKQRIERDDKLLVNIARTIHSWIPSESYLGLGHSNPELDSPDS